tara:strand:+ start:1382 stop:1756 length:375 start_codon:yes stop_codon:yes gene_type:complete
MKTNMDREGYREFHTALCKEALDLSMTKNHDYSGGEDGSDPFLNFKTVEFLGIGVSTEQGFMVRLADKLRRMSGFVKTGEFKVSDESFRDTVIDAINYLCLLSAYKAAKDEAKEEDSLFDHLNE